jgi:acyl-CoA reductase-like NAD-dependent aldehyde dehydrogenase
MGDVREFWVAGRRALGDDVLEVDHPWDGRLVARVSLPTEAQVEEAVAAADRVRAEFGATPAHVRADALAHVSTRLAERAEEVALLLVEENGKPLKWARGEVARAVSTFRWAAEEVRRWSGQLQRLDTDVAGEGRMAMVRCRPRGPVLAIAPFNFPLNLVAHKVAPSLAVGAPVIIKPAPATPLSALLLGELLAETALPEGAWSVLPVPNDRMPALVTDPRLPVVSFTGSGPVGWGIRDAVPRKHVVLELGGNAAAVICADWSTDADLDRAAERIAVFGTYQAGQSCVSVQRVLVDRAVYDRFLPRLLDRVSARAVGDPRDEKTDVGPLVDERAAVRVAEWVDEAVEAGAVLRAGGLRDGATYAPTVLTDVPASSRVWHEEVFGPVVAVVPFDGVDEAFAAVNDSRYGLQAGVFTHDVAVAFRAARELAVGGVVVGDVPSYRADQMPYGGVKESGSGREGVRSAMEDLTEETVLVLTGIAV